MASVLYGENGLAKIRKMLDGLETWMQEKNFSAISDFEGRLDHLKSPQTESYIRAQYIKSIAGVE